MTQHQGFGPPLADWLRWLGAGLLALVIMEWLTCTVFGQSNPVPAGAAAGAVPTPAPGSGSPNQTGPLVALLAALVPIVIAGVKQIAPQLPSWVLPLLAPVLGALGDLALQAVGLTSVGPGGGLREAHNQVGQRVADGPKLTNLPLWILSALLLLGGVGCKLFGTNAAAPGSFEGGLFNVTNVPMLTVRAMTNTVVTQVTNTVTNVVFVSKEVVTTNTVTQTNLLNQVVLIPVTVTNTVTNAVSSVTQQVAPQTNQVVTPAGSTVLVPQEAGMKPAGQAVVAGGSAVAGMFGWGALAGAVLLGFGNWWQAGRNKALAASYTGATSASNAANQTAGVLTQDIETLLEVLNTSPQGQAILPQVKSYLVQHQAEAGVFATVATLVENNVDNAAAKEAAAAILKAAAGLGASPAPAAAGAAKV